MKSRISEFYRFDIKERLDYVKRFANLSTRETEILRSACALKLGQANKMIENVVGFMPIPFGIAVNFVVNGREYLVPMATEQRSIISATSRAAKWTLATGGFKADSMESVMIGQVQLTGVSDHGKARRLVLFHKDDILGLANTQSAIRQAVDIEVKTLETAVGTMFIVELLVDVKDSMGANVVDSMTEAVAPLIESLTHGKANLRIVSNLATKRLVHVGAVVAEGVVGGTPVIDGIVKACAFAEKDPLRAATHNKGVMNGVSAVLLATGNDTRAVAAGAHAYAAISGQYRALSTWRKTSEGDLKGTLTMPMAVGIVGGSISTHPTAKIALKILRVKKARELGEVATAAGLASNLAALQALVTSGAKSI